MNSPTKLARIIKLVLSALAIGTIVVGWQFEVSSEKIQIGCVSHRNLPINNVFGKMTSSLGAVSVYYLGIPYAGAIRLRIEQTEWKRIDDANGARLPATTEKYDRK